MANIFGLEKAVALISNSDSDEENEVLEVAPIIQFSEAEAAGIQEIASDEIPLSHTVEVESLVTNDLSQNNINTSGRDDVLDDTGDTDCTYEDDNDDPDYKQDTDSDISEEDETNCERTCDASVDETAEANAVAVAPVDPTESNSAETESNTENEGDTGRSRKRKRNFNSWQKNIRKRKRQAGQAYTQVTGKVADAKQMKNKKDCNGQCSFKCSIKISNEQREQIFKSFWSLTDNEKFHFYSKTVIRNQKQRQRTASNLPNRRRYSFAYHFFVEENMIRVCKEYYLTTLGISQRRISYFFDRKFNQTTNVPTSGDLRGKATTDRIDKSAKQSVRDHINDFPRIESHYCRSSSNVEYLESTLTVPKMYRLYTEKCVREDRSPVKIHTYRHIFNSEFNLSFHKPKKDRCDRCEEYKVKSQHDLVDEELREEYLKHVQSKISTKDNRDNDRSDKNKLVVCFDLENVLTCPQANISSFYYRRKLSVFNLTAHCSLDGQGYCAVWNETQSGRGANEISSALLAILEKICEKHSPEKLTLWSDSCVAQNRNSGIAFALKDFMMKRDDVSSIEQKFCEPGHSSIQEVDSIHSMIERELVKSEIYSPLGLMRTIKASSHKQPFCIIQLRDEHFKKYLESSRLLNFTSVPFTKVKSILSEKNDPYSIHYKTSFTEDYKKVSVRPRNNMRRMSSPPRSPTSLEWPSVKVQTAKPVLSAEKAKDIRAMLKFMNPADKLFMSGLLP